MVAMALETEMGSITGRKATVTVKVLASLSGGIPSSVTRTVIWLVASASGSVVELERLNRAPAWSARSVMAARTGGRLVSRTKTRNIWVVIWDGGPGSM